VLVLVIEYEHDYEHDIMLTLRSFEIGSMPPGNTAVATAAARC
jgi:hypothetical protein